MAGRRKEGTTIVIRREESSEAGHHGGAWKVAYADFVTAMMAFFLLMWLLNATTEEQRKGLADYFTPSNLFSHNNSGAGAPFAGRSPYSDGAMLSDRGAPDVVTGRQQPQVDIDEDDSETPATERIYHRDGVAEPSRAERDHGQAKPNAPPGAAPGVAGAAEAAPGAIPPADPAAREKARFERAAEQIREAVAADPELAALAKQLAIDVTPEGLRVQLMDEERLPMFTTGSAAPNDRARLLLQKVLPVLQRLPEDISIAGHTDSEPFRNADRSNWELSAERANAMRRLLVDGGLPEGRIRSVVGNADRDPLLPADPRAAANRRIAIIVLRSAPTHDAP